MMMIVLRLLSLLGLKSRWHRHFSPRPLNKVFFRGWGGGDIGGLADSGLKSLCHRHPTGPHPSGLLWTPAKDDATKRDFALVYLTASRVLAKALAIGASRAGSTAAALSLAVWKSLCEPAMPKKFS